MIDLVRFKAINDRHGREAGDAVLCTLARALRQALLPGEHVARLHGDEFAACRLVAGPAEIEDFLARLRRALATPLHDGDMVIGTGAASAMPWRPRTAPASTS
jgi:diguanylate cyclase (GGDEF)-like protein